METVNTQTNGNGRIRIDSNDWFSSVCPFLIGSLIGPYVAFWLDDWTVEIFRLTKMEEVPRGVFHEKVRLYDRHMLGTMALSLVVVIGVVLFLYRILGMFFGGSSWSIFGRYYLPPAQFVLYFLMILNDPSNHVDTLCLLGQIMVPVLAFAYCGYMFYKSWQIQSYAEMAFYVFLTFLHISIMLPESTPGVFIFRPFLRRPEDEINADHMEIMKRFDPNLYHQAPVPQDEPQMTKHQ